MNKPVALNYLSPILIVVFMFQLSYPSQPTIDIITRVTNPEHYDSLARNHEIIKNLYRNWEITSVSTPYQQNKLVFFTLDFIVPKSDVPDSSLFEFSLSLKFSGDTLLNIREIESARMGLKADLENIKKNKFVRTFRSNSIIKSEYLFWGVGGYKYQIRSYSDDTLEIFPGWPTTPGGGWLSWFNFHSPNLLQVLEIYLNNLYPIEQILSFRNKAGIGLAIKKGEILQISSDSDCSNKSACMRIYHSGDLITAFKLPLNTDWSEMPYIGDALKEVNYLLITQANSECFSSILPPDMPFVIMCHQQNNLPRRLYFPILCRNKLFKIVSVQVDNQGSKDPSPIFHEPLILDSLIAEMKWNQ